MKRHEKLKILGHEYKIIKTGSGSVSVNRGPSWLLSGRAGFFAFGECSDRQNTCKQQKWSGRETVRKLRKMD